MSGKTNILCFLDYDSGRDVEILMPLIYFAEKHLNANIEFAFIYDVHKIYQRKPDLVLIANTIGSWLHHLIAKYAAENNIKVFALISEGNFKTDGTFKYWGYNTDKKFHQEYICHWSQRTLDFLSKELPQYQSKMVLTGATGFDRYKIYEFITKDEFLKKWNRPGFKKVIGYAGWAFGKMFNESGLKEIRNAHGENADQHIQWMKKQMLLVEDILRKAIENNPDTLFILKRHPNEIHPHLTQKDQNEMINLVDYPNVLYIRNEEDVHSLISISDIWLSFESTTVIETWLMKENPTIFINPDPDFNRDNNYKGTVIAKNYNQLQQYIDEFYQTNTIKDFLSKEKIKNRKEIIANTIGFGDGMNHLRAGFYLMKTMNKINPEKPIKVKFSPRFFRMHVLMHLGKHLYNRKIFIKLPKFKKTVWIFDRYRLDNLPVLKEKYYTFMDAFYAKNALVEKIKSGSLFNEIIKS